MQSFYAQGNKIEFSCKITLAGRKDMDSDCLCFLIIYKNGTLVESKDLTSYELSRLEDRIEELINKGVVDE